MENFIASNWFANRANLKIQDFHIEGVEFEIMALRNEHQECIKSCLTYEEMLSFAANNGISYNRKRVIDDPELAKDIGMFWGLKVLDIDLDPCIKYRVGEKICEISGLGDVLLDRLEADKQAAIAIDGDHLVDTSITLEQLERDAAAAAA